MVILTEVEEPLDMHNKQKNTWKRLFFLTFPQYFPDKLSIIGQQII